MCTKSVAFLVSTCEFLSTYVGSSRDVEILAYLLKKDLIDGNNMTVTGRTLGENLERWTREYGELSNNQEVIRPLERPIKETGHIRFVLRAVYITLDLKECGRVLTGNLAPGGAIAKITGKEGLGFTGKARAFDSEDEFVHAVESGSIKQGEKTVIVLRYLGPKGGPGTSLDGSELGAFDQTKT
jgi:dihydroxy-acid dehydratase